MCFIERKEIENNRDATTKVSHFNNYDSFRLHFENLFDALDVWEATLEKHPKREDKYLKRELFGLHFVVATQEAVCLSRLIKNKCLCFVAW